MEKIQELHEQIWLLVAPVGGWRLFWSGWQWAEKTLYFVFVCLFVVSPGVLPAEVERTQTFDYPILISWVPLVTGSSSGHLTSVGMGLSGPILFEGNWDWSGTIPT